MALRARSFTSQFSIKRGEERACAEAIQPLNRPPKFMDRFAPALPRIHEAFRTSNWELLSDQHGKIIAATLTGDKLRGVDVFEVVSPFVEPGSFIELWVEGADPPGWQKPDAPRIPNTRWQFDGRSMLTIDLVPREFRQRERQGKLLLRELQEQNTLRETTGLPPFCLICALHRQAQHELVIRPHPQAVNGLVYWHCEHFNQGRLMKAARPV